MPAARRGSWAGTRRRALVALALLLPLGAYLFVAVFWHVYATNPITGDEPHYLLVAHSILTDHDVLVWDDTFVDAPPAVISAMAPGATFASAHSSNGYTIHGLLLPLLVLPAYSLGGVLGAKLFMAALAGLIPFAVYALARAELGAGPWPLATAVVLALGQPFLAASNQVFPDLLAGLVVFYCLLHVWRLEREPAARRVGPRLLLLAALPAALPWLHIKLIAPAALIALGLAWAHARPRPARAVRGWLLGSGLLVAVAWGGLLAYNAAAFGRVLGPYGGDALSSDWRAIAVIALGLHLDRLQGLFIQAPLLLLGVVGLVPFVKERPTFAALWAAVYLALLLPNAAHPVWYGGYSLAGRFAWPLALLWCFPLLVAVRRLLAARQGAWLAGAFAVAFVGQMLFGWIALRLPFYLYNDGLSPADPWLRRNPYADWLRLGPAQVARFLPSFRALPGSLLAPANLVDYGVVLACLASGWALAARRRTVAALAWLAAGLLAVAIFAGRPGPLAPATYSPDRLRGEASALVDGERRSAPDASGLVVVGAESRVGPAEYEVIIEYETGPEADGRLTWQCVVAVSGRPARRVPVGGGPLPPSAANGGRLAGRCRVGPELTSGKFEIDVVSSGGAAVAVRRMSFVPVGR